MIRVDISETYLWGRMEGGWRRLMFESGRWVWRYCISDTSSPWQHQKTLYIVPNQLQEIRPLWPSRILYSTGQIHAPLPPLTHPYISFYQRRKQRAWSSTISVVPQSAELEESYLDILPRSYVFTLTLNFMQTLLPWPVSLL